MGNKKNKGRDDKVRQDPAFHNDQLGENAGEGRMIKENDKKKKR